MVDNRAENPTDLTVPWNDWEDYIRPRLAKISELSSPSARTGAEEAFFSSFDKRTKFIENTPQYEKQIAEAFLSVADAIKDKTFFWELAGQFWIMGGVNNTNYWDAFFDHPTFRKLPVAKRIKLWHPKSVYEGYPETLYSDWREDRPILVYRTFRARDGKQIRRSNNKGDLEFFEQVEGQGFSYSLSKIAAIDFSSIGYNDKINEKYFSDPASIELARQMSESSQTTTYGRDNQLGNRAYLGAFHLKKSDIVSLAFSRNEEEVVSRRSHLIHYKPITLYDYLSARALKMSISEIEQSENCLVIGHKMAEQKLLKQTEKFIRNLNHEWKFLIAQASKHPFKNSVSLEENKGVTSLFFNWEKKVLRPTRRVNVHKLQHIASPEIVTFIPQKDQSNLLNLFS